MTEAAKKKSQPQQAADDCLHGYEELVVAIIDAHHKGRNFKSDRRGLFISTCRLYIVLWSVFTN